MTLQRLKKIILRMENAGFHIKAVVFDMGNSTFLKDIKYKDHNHFFCNPADITRKVYIFPDAPHLIKSARNALIDPHKGFRYTLNGVTADLRLKHFEEVREAETSELKMAFKIDKRHLYANGQQKQNVRTACQLLSNTVAEAMKFGKDDPETLLRSKMIKIFNNWWDVVNSKHMYTSNDLNCGFGVKIEKQLAALDEMENFLSDENFKVFDRDKHGVENLNGRNNLKWTHGILIHIKATRALYYNMVKNGPLKYIMMRKVNQDCLENFFSRFRGIGGDDVKPGPVMAMKRIRNLLFTKLADVAVKKPSVELEEVDNDERDILKEEEDILVSSRKFTKDLNVEIVPETSQNQEISVEYTDDTSVRVTDETVYLDLNESKKLNRSFQGLSYVLGFVARNFKEDYPALGKQVANLTPDEIESSVCSWLFIMSNRGKGLTVPSDDFLKDGEIMEEKFNKFHSTDVGYNTDTYVIDRFTDVLVSHFGTKYDRKVLAYFSKTRTFIRIKDLNIVLKDEIALNKGTRDHRQIGNLTTYKLKSRPKVNTNVQQAITQFKCIFCPLSFNDLTAKEIHVISTHINESVIGPVRFMPTF